MYLWGLLLLSLPVALLMELLLPIRLIGGWGFLPWMHGMMIYYALHQKLSVALVAALLGGLLVDCYTLGQPGVAVLLYGIVVYLADRFRRQIIPDAMITAAVFGVAASLGLGLLRLGMLWMDGHRGVTVVGVLAKLGFMACTGALFVPLVVWVMHAMHRALDLVASEGDQHVNA